MSNGEKNMGQTRKQREQSQFRPWEFPYFIQHHRNGVDDLDWNDPAPYVALLGQKYQNGEKLQKSLGLFQILEVTIPQLIVDF